MSGDVLATNLGAELTSFVGRARELAELDRVLLRTRLLTLTGPGGCGKTRLAQALARRSLARFRGGAWQVELAALDRPGLLPQAVAAALGVPEPADRPLLAAIADRLRSTELLLLLDNCEHLVADVAAHVDPLLRSCSGLRVLATSQSPLGIEGELLWPVSPLALPDERAASSAIGIGAVESVRLFCDRARLASPGFALTDENAVAIRAICEGLDGLPLAVELAAARVRVLSVSEIADRLGDRFALLRGGPSSLPRHQSLRAMLDWSYELLDAPERVLWARLAAFAGGFELEAAEFVCAGRVVRQNEVFDLLARLVDRSMLIAERRGERTRYRMLESTREYARERLSRGSDQRETRDRHLAWFTRLASRAAQEWRGAHQTVWLDRIEEEVDNIRVALDWARAEPLRVLSGLALATDLWLYWHLRGRAGEGRGWLAEISLAGAAPAAVLAEALNASGFLAYLGGDTAAALPLLERASRLADDSGDRRVIGFARLRLGIGAYYDGDLGRARALLEEALARYRALEDETGEYVALYELAEVLSYMGDHQRSLTLHRESLLLKERHGDRWHIAMSLFGMGLLAWLQGDPVRASALGRRALGIQHALDDRWGMGRTLEVLAWAAASETRFRRAGVLLGAADRTFASIGARLCRNHRAAHDACVAAVTAALARSHEAALSQGRRLAPAAAVAFALSDEEVPSERSRAAATKSGPLSGREREIAGLVARGLTNREIAADLYIAERTVDAHLAHILDKLALRSRTQIATWLAGPGAVPDPAGESVAE